MKFPIYHKLLIYRIALLDDYSLIIYQNMSQEPTISTSDVLSLFQPKILAAIDYIRNVNKQRPDAEAIYQYISRTETSNVNKAKIVISIDEMVKQNVIVNKKINSCYVSFFLNNDNPVSRIPQMELASNSTTPIITPGEPNSATPTNSPVTPNATLTGSNKKPILRHFFLAIVVQLF